MYLTRYWRMSQRKILVDESTRNLLFSKRSLLSLLKPLLNGGNITAGIDIRLSNILWFIRAAVLSIFTAREIACGPRSWGSPSDFTFNTKDVMAHLHPNISHLSPVLSPAVANNPMRMLFAGSVPTDDRYDVIGFLAGGLILKNASRIINNRFRIDHGSDWTASINLSHYLVDVAIINTAVLGYRSVREHVNLGTFTSHATEGVARLASVDSGASSINMRTESFSRFSRTGKVWQTCIEGDVAGILDELIRRRVISTVTGACNFGATIQNELNA
mmetsp:Transcript_27000/g.59998  ORF Transcript_27000/g.59998 Transcript_27000/m.59998 type:complete len:274 (+) Transcript_27000:118-939(+)